MSYLLICHFYKKKRPVLMFFSMKFPIEWAINKLSTIILKIFENGNFNDEMKIFKIVVESSVIAHSIGNFVLKNIKTGSFLIKMTYEEIWWKFSFFRTLTKLFLDTKHAPEPFSWWIWKKLVVLKGHWKAYPIIILLLFWVNKPRLQ